MKTTELLSGLSPAEVKDFIQSREVQRSKDLPKLILQLEKYARKGESPAKEQLVKDIFKEKYSDKRYQSLRVKLSHLSKLITDFMVQKELEMLTQKESAYQAHLMKAYFRRGLNNLFDKEFSKALEEANKALDYNSIDRLETTYFARTIRNQRVDYKSFAEALAHSKHRLTSLVKEFKVRYRDAEESISYLIEGLRRNKFNLGDGFELSPAQNLNLEAEEYDDAWAAYHLSMTKANLAEDTETKVKELKACLAALDRATHTPLQSRGYKSTIYGTLANTLLQVGQFEEALDYARKEEEIDREKIGHISSHSLYYQGMALYQLGYYQQALDLINKERSAAEGSSMIEAVDWVKAMALLRLERTNEASDIFLRIANEKKDLAAVQRILLAIDYYRSGHLTVAINELSNLIRSAKSVYGEDNIGVFHAVCQPLLKFFRALYKEDRNPERDLRPILEELQTEEALKGIPFIISTVPDWLRDEIKSVLAKAA